MKDKPDTLTIAAYLDGRLDDDQRDIVVQFAQDNRAMPTTFTFQTEEPDKNYFESEFGVSAVFQNGVSIYHGVTIEDDVFLGPHMTFTNDLYPRAFDPEWHVVTTRVRQGASVGANVTVVCGVELGEYCMVGAGAVILVGGAATLATVYLGLPFLPLQPFETEATRRNVGQYGTIIGVGSTVAGVVSLVIGGGLIVGHYALEE